MAMKEKKRYLGPEIRKINLTPEEAVLAGCKTVASPTGKSAGSNDCSTRDNFCSTAAS